MEANLNFTSNPYAIHGIKRNPTSVKNPQANAILECVHAVKGTMLRTSELNIAEMVKPSDIDIFLSVGNNGLTKARRATDRQVGVARIPQRAVQVCVCFFSGLRLRLGYCNCNA